jgi:proton-dependent oligopeptide transporter, POT family
MVKEPGSEIQDFSDDPNRKKSISGNYPSGTEWFGHPRGLATLFFTEMWERFSYYGMRAILFLFMTAAVFDGGMGMDERMAGAIYGLYTSMVYLLALPGGWVADNLWGQRKAVFIGGIFITMGHFSLAAPLVGIPEMESFYLGLFFIVIGTGLLKPNVSTMVADLYPEGGARRDAGFSIFYMGINIGAFFGPLVCGYLGEDINWHLGFSAAGVGMVFGLIQYKMGYKLLGTAGDLKTEDSPHLISRKSRNFYLITAFVAGLVLVFSIITITGVINVTLPVVANWVGVGIVLLTVLFFVYLTLGNIWILATLAVALIAYVITMNTNPDNAAQISVGIAVLFFIAVNMIKLAVKTEAVSMEKRRVMVIFWLFLLAAMFWAGFEQAGSSMNTFAKDLTDREIFGWNMPASWLQSINPVFIILFAPVFGWLWTWLARRKANPSIPLKFSLGLLGLAGGFFVLAWGAANASNENLVAPSWLVVTYFLHTVGELMLSPVGLSSVTKLAPKGRVGQMMGIWFIASALGNLFAGLVAGELEDLPHNVLFWNLAIVIGGMGIVTMLISPGIKKLMGDVK